MRRLATTLVISLLLLFSAEPIGAERAERDIVRTEQSSNGTPTLTVSSETSGGATRTRGSSGITCRYLNPSMTSGGQMVFTENTGGLEEGAYYAVRCADRAGTQTLFRIFQHTPAAPPVSAFRLALAARTSLEMPPPGPQTNPARQHDQLVGIDTWLWVDPADWQPLTASVAIPGISATVTATPVRSEWDMGDGQDLVVCHGPGTPYDTSRPEASQSTDCSHLYQVRGAYTATATIVYEVTWSASNGEGGTLEPARRSTPFPMSVAERQAVG